MKYLVLLLALSPSALACPKGCFDYEGVCACEAPQPDLANVHPVKPDDAKPPKNPQPEWETGKVKTVNEPIKQHMDDAPDMADAGKPALITK